MPSSVIAATHYNAETKILRIVFVSGTEYDYKNVPEEVYKTMQTAFSKGVYFNEYIKDKYSFNKIK